MRNCQRGGGSHSGKVRSSTSLLPCLGPRSQASRISRNEDMRSEGGATVSERMAFSVDTHLLRELGALLVGRDSTALLEMIKNAYDADATSVSVHGADLGAP